MKTSSTCSIPGRAWVDCIDLGDLPPGTPIHRLRLGFDDGGKTLTVAGPDGPLAEVDTETLAVSEPKDSSGAAGTIAVLAIAAGAICALFLSISIPRARRRRAGARTELRAPGTSAALGTVIMV